MIVNAQGKPYSKRDGAAFVGEFRDSGYLPDALFNYLLLLGWNPGDDREVLTKEEMISLFDLEKVHVTAAKFDLKKLQWMNGEYIKRIPTEDFIRSMKDAVESDSTLDASGKSDEWWNALAGQMQIRTKFLKDMPSSVSYFFTEEYSYDEKAVEKRLKKEGVIEILADIAQRFENAGEWNTSYLENLVKELSQGNGMGPWVHPIRVAVSGRTEGPGLFEMLELLGRERTINRIRKTIEMLKAL
jgi:glutamyl-tRNA synthetase